MTEHEPRDDSYSGGGTFAVCAHCEAKIVKSAVGTPETGYGPTAWRTGGTDSGAVCDAR
jgi:hypothetical protein